MPEIIYDPEYIDNYIDQLSKIEDALNEYRENASLDALYRLNSDERSSAFLKKWMEMAKLPDPTHTLEQLNDREVKLSKLSPYADIMLHCQPNWDKAVDLIHIVYVYSGEFRCQLKDQDIILTTGMCCMFNVNVNKYIAPCSADAKLLNCLISQTYLETILLKQFDRNVFFSDFLTQSFYTDSTSEPVLIFDTTNNISVKRAFAMAIIEYTNHLPLYQSMINGHISVLMIHLLRLYMETRDRQHYMQLGNHKLSDILIYIDNHCDTATLENVAETFHFHPSYLSKIIKNNTGMTFTKILQNTRLKQAAALLRSTDLSITDIAHHVGYSNITHFYKLFQEKFGYTPAEYRDSKGIS